MKILMIGGTGILSTDITELAVKRGHEVWLINRGHRPDFIAIGAHKLIADIYDKENVEKLLGDNTFDVICDFISYRPADLRYKLDLLSKRAKQYIFVSSATVYSREKQSELIREDQTPTDNLLWEYSRSKIACEQFLKKYDDLYGLCYTVVRPYVTYGRTRIPFPLIPGSHWTLCDRILRGAPLLMPERGENVCTLTHASDFAVGFLGLCMNPMAYREAFHITSGKNYHWQDVAEAVGKVLGKKPCFAYAPIRDIALAMPESYGDVYSMLKGDKATSYYFDNRKISAAVPEFQATVSLEDGIASTVRFYQSRPDSCRIDENWNKVIDGIIAEYS